MDTYEDLDYELAHELDILNLENAVQEFDILRDLDLEPETDFIDLELAQELDILNLENAVEQFDILGDLDLEPETDLELDEEWNPDFDLDLEDFYPTESELMSRLPQGNPPNCKPKMKKLFYQQRTHVNEFENKKQFKCIWVSLSLKEEKEMVLYPNKNGNVGNLLEEAKKQIELLENGSGKLRILEITSNKVSPGPKDEVPLESLNTSGSKIYRIEEIPLDEINLADDEMLVPVAHFHKDVFSTFGIPFLCKIKHGEPFSKMIERIFKRLDIQDKEFKKFKFAIVQCNKAKFISQPPEYLIDIKGFKSYRSQIVLLPNPNALPQKPWLGVSKAPKGFSINYLKKTIKIDN